MNCKEVSDALNSIAGWKVVTEFSVGGFEWLAFSKRNPGKMLVISSQKITLVDCNTGVIEVCDADYDEEERIAYCDKLLDEELALVGQYGGKLPSDSGQNEKIRIETSSEYITKAMFVTEKERTLFYDNYGFYACGFSCDGNYFVLADDGGISIMKRQ